MSARLRGVRRTISFEPVLILLGLLLLVGTNLLEYLIEVAFERIEYAAARVIGELAQFSHIGFALKDRE